MKEVFVFSGFSGHPVHHGHEGGVREGQGVGHQQPRHGLHGERQSLS